MPFKGRGASPEGETRGQITRACNAAMCGGFSEALGVAEVTILFTDQTLECFSEVRFRVNQEEVGLRKP